MGLTMLRSVLLTGRFEKYIDTQQGAPNGPCILKIACNN
jgi:hypothetical protein